MEDNDVKIVSFDKTTVRTITSFSVQVLQINLFKSALLNIRFFGNNKELVESQILEITGEDYSNWGSDDNYINNFVASKFNLVIQNS